MRQRDIVQRFSDMELTPFKLQSSDKGSKNLQTKDKNRIRAEMGVECCLLCGTDRNVTLAHLIHDNKQINYSRFSKLYYNTSLTLDSPRCFLLLCGSSGAKGTCHNEFDCNRVILFYCGFRQRYIAKFMCDDFRALKSLSNGLIEIPESRYSKITPYNRLLRARSNQVINDYEGSVDVAIIDSVKSSAVLSEKSSVAGEPDDGEGAFDSEVDEGSFAADVREED